MAEIWIDVNTATTLPVNLLPLVDDTDFKTIKTVVSSSSIHLDWNFVPTAGSQTQITVEASTSGSYTWKTIGNGIFGITLPATGGSYINNNATGFGWFTGSGTGVLPWRSPVIGFRSSILNNNLIDDANALATGSGLATIPTTDYTSLISTRMSGSYIGSLASASRVEAIQTTVNSIPTTNYTNLISTRMSGSYLGNLASASRVEAIYSDMANVGDVWTSASRTLTSASGLGLASASSVFPPYQVIENSITHEQAIKLLLSVLVGTSSGGGTTTQIFNNLLNSGSRVTATTDSNGNRTAVDLNVT